MNQRQTLMDSDAVVAKPLMHDVKEYLFILLYDRLVTAINGVNYLGVTILRTVWFNPSGLLK